MRKGEIPSLRKLICREIAPNLMFSFPNVITALFLALEKDLRSRMAQIQSPCLLLWSSQDLTTPLSVAEAMYHLISHARLVVVEEGCHEWGLWYPEKFSSIITSFINQAA
jgi:pimeloyl-ACP methyl ester carboxylesterase